MYELARIGLVVTISALLASACGGGDADEADFAGAVELGDGRRVFMQCQGRGSPTVVLISGKGTDAADWSQVLDASDPVRNDPLDEVGAGLGNLHDSDDAVFPAVSTFTRVCAYDRPDTRANGADITSSRPQPHSVDLDVRDLHDLLAAAAQRGPYVLVPHSYGGFVAELYARTYPSQVVGLVMVDAASSRLRQTLDPARLAVWDQTNRQTSAQVREGVEVADALDRIAAAPTMPELAAVVLAADKPYRTDLIPPELADKSLRFVDWKSAQELLAPYLHARFVADTNSGHHVYLYSPQLVISAVREVVDVVRARPAASTLHAAGAIGASSASNSRH